VFLAISELKYAVNLVRQQDLALVKMN